jgi:drug/metabolite transporter (DMT)-like permease
MRQRIESEESGGVSGAAPGPLAVPVAFAALTMGAIAMGASPVFVRLAEVGPFASAFWRVALALPLLFAWALVEAKHEGRRLTLSFSRAITAAGCFFAGDLLFWHLAIVNTTVANATLMACLAPVWVLVLSGIVLGERVDGRSFVGLAVCVVGAAMLIGSSLSVEPDRLIGDFYGIVTSFFFGLYFLAVRIGRRQTGGGKLLFLSTLVTAPILGAAALLAGDALLPATVSGYSALVSLGVISHAGGQGMLAFALGALTAAFSSLVIFVEAIAAAVLGLLIFGETMGPLQVAGSCLILGGVWLARPRRDAPARGLPPTSER